MEAEETMVIRDLPVSTRNYTIIDNVTGKPIDQETYSLTIDKEVVKKLNRLKLINEEKVRQASLRNQYSDALVTTFTPQNNNVFSPIYSGEYIDAEDFVTTKTESLEETEVKEEVTETQTTETMEEAHIPAETYQTENVLQRVVARDPREIPAVEEVEEEVVEEKPELDYITMDTFEGEIPDELREDKPKDNSIFTPEENSLASASEQIVKIDTTKLKEVKGSNLHAKEGRSKINLDREEIREGRGIAWLAYILFFIPLLFKRNNRFVRLHANEGLELNIMEIVSAILIAPYFLLSNLTGTLHTVILALALCGLIILGACALTIVPMMLSSLFGVQFQIPWLWRKRIIKVNENSAN